jgi:hypothetical protein
MFSVNKPDLQPDYLGGVGEEFYEDIGDDSAARAAQGEWSDELRSDLQMDPDKLESMIRKWPRGREVWLERLVNMWMALDIQLHEQEENSQDSSALKTKTSVYLVSQVRDRLRRYKAKGEGSQ